jgi:membrane protease YdiL (CAAX protease family)
MTDKPEDRPEERRRTGPLGDDAESTEARREPPAEADAHTTRRVSSQQPGQSAEAQETERAPSSEEDKETRVIRAPGGYGTAQDATPYPRGYFEAVEEREDRLRDMYGGVDWLASFLGFIFAAVVAVLFSLVAGLVLAPWGFSLNLGGEIGAAVITGLVLVALLIFLIYFFGGYVAGRLARFDGGRNGAMLLLWTLAAALLAALAGGIFSSFLPSSMSENIRDFIQNNVLSTIGNLAQLGIVGILVAIGAVLVALLGGFLGGRLGSRYHSEIDRTT